MFLVPLSSPLSPATSLSLLPSLSPATSLSLSLHSILLRWVTIISLTSLLLWTKSIQLHVFYCNSQTRKYCKILLNFKFEIFTLLSYFYSLMKILLASQHINCLPWTMIHIRVKFKLKVNLPHPPPYDWPCDWPVIIQGVERALSSRIGQINIHIQLLVSFFLSWKFFLHNSWGGRGDTGGWSRVIGHIDPGSSACCTQHNDFVAAKIPH